MLCFALFEKDKKDDGFKIGVVLNVEISGVADQETKDLAESSHEVCPYSKAIRGNVDVTINAKAV